MTAGNMTVILKNSGYIFYYHYYALSLTYALKFQLYTEPVNHFISRIPLAVYGCNL